MPHSNHTTSEYRQFSLIPWKNYKTGLPAMQRTILLTLPYDCTGMAPITMLHGGPTPRWQSSALHTAEQSAIRWGRITEDSPHTSAGMLGSFLGQGADSGDCNAASCNCCYLLAATILESKTITKHSSPPPAAAALTWASPAREKPWVPSVPASFSASQVVTLRSFQPRQGNHQLFHSSEPLRTPKDEVNRGPGVRTSLLWLQREPSSHADLYPPSDESLLTHFYSVRWKAAVAQQ